MTTTAVCQQPSTRCHADADRLRCAVAELREWFGAELSLLDAESGDWLHLGSDQPHESIGWLAEACREASRREQPEFVYDEDPCLAMAVPLWPLDGRRLVALGTFLTRPVVAMADMAAAGKAFGMATPQAATWAARQEIWRPNQLLRIARLVQRLWRERWEGERARGDVDKLSANLSDTYEEISLIYRLTQNLKISSREVDLGQNVLEWLADVLPARGLSLQLLATSNDHFTTHSRPNSVLLQFGECLLDERRFQELLSHLKVERGDAPRIVNLTAAAGQNWPFPDISQLIVVPITAGEHLFGWLAAFNHVQNQEFGSVEANLLLSVASMLGIHGGNVEMYRQQAEFLEGVVRAMTSAIDAKDPYTCGHSDRVARVAVRLGKELACEPKELNTLYMAGLLHDIGKIGVSDDVLRKPGKLTEHEYEHIKTHVEVGYRILLDVKQFDQVLPVVRHHHEAWNGAGYPQALTGRGIPYLARIVAVADAFDAMTSDRPYRKGMPDARLDEVFRAGAGKQWDPHVIDAFFRCRDEIRQLASRERDQLSLDVQQWS